MAWQLKGSELINDDYKITNFGKKGGKQYCLWKYRKDYDCYCQLIEMGKLDILKSRINRGNDI